MIISRIASRGLRWGDNNSIPPTQMTTFHGSIIAFSRDRPSTCYVPLKFNLKAVDAIYVEVDERRNTVAKRYGDSPADFLQNGNNGPTRWKISSLGAFFLRDHADTLARIRADEFHTLCNIV